MKNDYLAHYGVKGMEWYRHQQGKWQNQAQYAVGDQRHIDGSPMSNGLFSKSYNLDALGKDKDHNILFITGVSGSGKSTLANKKAKELGAEVIHLDEFTEGYKKTASKEFMEHLKKNAPDYKKMASKISTNEKWAAYDRFTEAIESYAAKSQEKGKPIIVEGVQLLDESVWPEKRFFKNKPVIILNTPKLLSYYRSRKRDDIKLSKSDWEEYSKNFDRWKEFTTKFLKESDNSKSKYSGLPDKSLDDKFDDYLGEVRDRLNSTHYFRDSKARKQDNPKKIFDPPEETLDELKHQDGTKSIKDIRMSINHPDGNTAGRHFNCPNCAVAFELTERGYDVVSRPKKYRSNVENIDKMFKGGKLINICKDNNLLGINDKYKEWQKTLRKYYRANESDKKSLKKQKDKLRKDYWDTYGKVIKEEIDDLKKELLSQGDGARGIMVQAALINTNPKVRTNAFHAFNYKVEDGKIKMFDTQGKNVKQQNGHAWVDEDFIDFRDLYYMRTDNLELSPLVTTAVYSNKY